MPGSLDSAGLDTARAVVCVMAGDQGELRNLHVALHVRERRPDVRVVTSLGNAAIGRAVAADPGPGAVLDVAALVTPALVEACLLSPVHALDVAGTRFVAAGTTARAPATLRALYGDLAPLAVTTEPDGATNLCPSRDHEVAGGDRVTVLGTDEELTDAGVEVTTAVPLPRRGPTTRRGAGYDPDAVHGRAGVLQRAAAAVIALGRESDRGLRWAIAALVGLLVVSTTVITLGYHDPDGRGLGVVDALYFTVESVATVGFGDFSFADQAVWLRLWAVFLMLAGVVTTAIPIAYFTDMLISRRLSTTAGRRAASASVGHVVIVGLGAVGVSVAEALHGRGRDVVVVESDPANRHLPRARALRIPWCSATRRPRTPCGTRGSDGRRRSRSPPATTWPTSRPAWPCGTCSAAGARTSRWCCGCSTGSWPTPSRSGSGSGRCARSSSWPPRGSSVRPSGSTCSPRSPCTATPSCSAGCGSTRAARSTGSRCGDLSLRTRVVALRRAAGDGDDRRGAGPLEHPPRRDTRFAAGDEAFLVGPRRGAPGGTGPLPGGAGREHPGHGRPRRAMMAP